ACSCHLVRYDLPRYDHGSDVFDKARANRHGHVNYEEKQKEVRRDEVDGAGRLPSAEYDKKRWIRCSYRRRKWEAPKDHKGKESEHDPQIREPLKKIITGKRRAR